MNHHHRSKGGRGKRPPFSHRLAVAIRGRSAFRRFKDELARWPGELERWHALSEERQRGRARSWLAAAGYRALSADRFGRAQRPATRPRFDLARS